MRARNLGLSVASGAVASGLATRALRTRRTRVAGKVALITGASRGLGLLLAQELGSRGAKVAICARDEEELHRAARTLREKEIRVFAMACDVTDPQQIKRLVEETERRLGPIDVLVNNAGVIQVGPALTMNDRDFDEAMDVNYRAARRLTGAVLRSMLQRGSGRIANISSIGGVVAVPHLLPYAASKFALTGWSSSLSTELSGTGVSVLTVVPGLMRTGSFVNALFKGKREREVDWFTLGASLPGLSMGAERAARRIADAIESRRRWITIGLQWKAMRTMATLAPDATLGVEGLVSRWVLPSRGSAPKSQAAEPGHAHRRGLARSPLTWLGDRAARRLNERRV